MKKALCYSTLLPKKYGINDTCYGLMCVLPKFICYILKTQYPRTTLYFEIESLKRQLSFNGSLHWALIKQNWCPYKKRLGHRQPRQRDKHVVIWIWWEGGHLQIKDWDLKKNKSTSRTVRKQICCFSHQACGIFLTQSQETNTIDF